MKNQFKEIVFCLIIILFSTNLLTAQKLKPLYYIGGYADFNFNIHSADFRTLPGVPNCCPRFVDGSGNGLAFGGLLDIPVINWLDLNIRIGFSDISGKLSENENIGNTRILRGQPPNNEFIEPVIVEHLINSNIQTIGFEPVFGFSFFERLKSYAGLKLSYIIKSNFDQQEKIISPQDVTFTDGRIIRNDLTNQELPNVNKLQFFGVFGLSWEFPAGKDIYIAPELRYYLPFSNISSVDWKAATLSLGGYVKFPIYPSVKKVILYDTTIIRDTTVIAELGRKIQDIVLNDRKTEKISYENDDTTYVNTIIKEDYIKYLPKESILNASLKIYGKTRTGEIQDVPTIKIEETEVTEGFPLLMQVFFKKGDSNLSLTSMKLLNNEETKKFDEQLLPHKTLEIYGNLLNIIGSRLRSKPNSTITLIGCNDNLGQELNNIQLSEERVNSIKNYLVKVWGINPDRISMKKQNLPDKPSNNTIEDGMEENRRVEIISSDGDLIKPVFLTEIERKSNPPIIEIEPVIISDAGVKDIDLIVQQDDNIIRNFPSNYQSGNKVIWNVEEEPIPKLESPIDIKLTAVDAFDKKESVVEKISINQITIRKKRYELKNDRRIERFSLILFDFDKADITSEQIKLLGNIKKSIKNTSFVTITGFADRIGDKNYNKELSLRRCQEVQKILKIPESNLKMVPIGSDLLLYDNDIPEGRSYSRTVQIEISTPVTDKE